MSIIMLKACECVAQINLHLSYLLSQPTLELHHAWYNVDYAGLIGSPSTKNVWREMKGPWSMIFACLILRMRFIAPPTAAVAAAGGVTVVAHANMPGRGDVTSGVSFFAVCTYHRVPGEKNECDRERERKEKERERRRERSHAYAAVAVAVRTRMSYLHVYIYVYIHIYAHCVWLHTHDRSRSRGYTWGARCVSANAALYLR